MDERGVPSGEARAHFARSPRALALYEALEARILGEFSPVRIAVGKTQVSFSNRYNFAFASLPRRAVRGCFEACIVVTFGLPYPLESPRVAEAVEPYPRRWTHHVPMARAEEIDDELMGWIRESFAFSMHKGRGRGI